MNTDREKIFTWEAAFMPKTGVNNTRLKQQNRGLILQLIATGECSSRIELAQQTGLSKMTVTYIVNEFLEQGVLEEREKMQVDGKGRNPIQLCISHRAPKLIGVHIHRERCSVFLCDMHLQVLKKLEYQMNENVAEEFFPHIFRSIDEILDTFPEEKIFGIGIGSMGPVDTLYGEILTPIDFYGLHDLEVKRKIQTRYHLPTYFDGECNCAAIAEKYYGSGSDCDDFLYVGLGNGVGVGVIVNGELYKNGTGMICELGHTSIDWNGIPCDCGNRGCLEKYISSDIIERRLTEATGDVKTFAAFCSEMEDALVKKEKGMEWTEREKKMDVIFSDMTEKLACGLISFCNSFNPQRVIIGHEGWWIPDYYLLQAEEILNCRQIFRKYRKIPIVKAFFGTESTRIGCTGALLTAIFNGELI